MQREQEKKAVMEKKQELEVAMTSYLSRPQFTYFYHNLIEIIEKLNDQGQVITEVEEKLLEIDRKRNFRKWYRNLRLKGFSLSDIASVYAKPEQDGKTKIEKLRESELQASSNQLLEAIQETSDSEEVTITESQSDEESDGTINEGESKSNSQMSKGQSSSNKRKKKSRSTMSFQEFR